MGSRFSQHGQLRRVYMRFFLRKGWTVSFLESDLKTMIGRSHNFADSDSVELLAERGRAFKLIEDRQAFDVAISNGSGGIFLLLTDEQYAKLKGR